MTEAISDAAIGPFDFRDWHRVVPYEYSLEPLSAVGSVKAANGGRFNLGGIDPIKFPEFPALYLAERRETALAEKLGIPLPEAKAFSALDLALRTEGSITQVVVRGHLEMVIDLRQVRRLKRLVDLIAAFEIPRELFHRAREAGLPAPTLVTSTEELLRALMQANWREWPAIFDVPATSQIFGQEVRAAGIEGIVYPSSKTGTPCLAVFPSTLGPQSFVEIQGAAPPGVITRLDATSWHSLV